MGQHVNVITSRHSYAAPGHRPWRVTALVDACRLEGVAVMSVAVLLAFFLALLIVRRGGTPRSSVRDCLTSYLDAAAVRGAGEDEDTKTKEA